MSCLVRGAGDYMGWEVGKVRANMGCEGMCTLIGGKRTDMGCESGEVGANVSREGMCSLEGGQGTDVCRSRMCRPWVCRTWTMCLRARRHQSTYKADSNQSS